MSALRFAAIGLNHNHIYGQVNCLLRAGAELVAFHAVEDDLAAEFAQAFPQAKRVADQRAILEDATHRAGRLGGDLRPSARRSRSRRCGTARTCCSTSRA